MYINNHKYLETDNYMLYMVKKTDIDRWMIKSLNGASSEACGHLCRIRPQGPDSI